MAKEIYLTVDGKQVALTDEQLKALGLYEEPKKSPFERVKEEKYYIISNTGTIECIKDLNWDSDRERYNIANYCTDKRLLKQRALHEILNRLLWRFSMQNDGDKIDWENGKFDKWLIYYEKNSSSFKIADNCHQQTEGTIYFHTKGIAYRAIDEIILPFMKEHPEFVW